MFLAALLHISPVVTDQIDWPCFAELACFQLEQWKWLDCKNLLAPGSSLSFVYVVVDSMPRMSTKSQSQDQE